MDIFTVLLGLNQTHILKVTCLISYLLQKLQVNHAGSSGRAV